MSRQPDATEVYGVRQAYAAVEFDKVFGYWLELEGQFDKALAASPPGVQPSICNDMQCSSRKREVASTCILTAWRERGLP